MSRMMRISRRTPPPMYISSLLSKHVNAYWIPIRRQKPTRLPHAFGYRRSF
jgi:hypothetical protein